MIVFGFLMRSADKTADQEQEKKLLKRLTTKWPKRKEGEEHSTDDLMQVRKRF